ncbi:NAD-binding lipoprotein [Streptomyces cyaneogriseus subsp. noncyanogenus]|uniref:NAD-binding lipoprotein n=1 Tax=Streptomyces cyaneogriseus subsp. noncyanogenus TaxID=477245 RepID=A0A0C5GAQ7_9ACTN|nr:NAD-binding lipoprotein [Streptomyces cyaneogriseus]AJP05399.1 NAD-binding lipoprotein [Streptomyces cyaneogriseus subsp. noncyanogenus]
MGRRRSRLGDRTRYWFDSTLSYGALALVGWLALLCLAVVVPASAVLVWTDPKAPASLTDRLAAVWRLTGETLRLGGATGTPLRVAVSVLLALITLLYVSTLVGLITTALTEHLMALRRGRSTVLERGHAVVLGWSEQVFTVVGELVAANANQHRAAVVVLADRDKTDMEEALATKVGPAGATRLICRSGPVTDPAVLALTSPAEAGVVLVLPHDRPDADAEVVKTLLALGRALPGRTPRPAVVAAVRNDRYRLAAALAAGADGVVLESDTITARLVVQAARHPGLSLVHRELLDFAGHEFYVIAEPGLAGRAFGEALLSYATSSVVGLVREGTPLLGPPPQTRIRPDDRLLVLSHDDDPVGLEECAALVEETVTVCGPRAPQRPERVLLLGWNRRAPLMIDQLRRGAPPRSAVDVVTDGDEATARQVADADTDAGTCLTLTLHRGDVTRPATLRHLDIGSYDSVIVLGGDPAPGRPSGEPDDRTLVTLLLLRDLERTIGRELPVVTELVDDRNRALAPISPGADVIVSGKLIGLLMAQISQNRHLAAVFEELFSAEGSGVHLRPATEYVLPDRETAFATVVAAARDRGECAIGYRSHDDVSIGPAYGLRINPPKSERRCWTARDEVVVVGEDRG